VKPPAFAYHVPETLAEAIALLSRNGNARVLAGGQIPDPFPEREKQGELP